VANQRSKMRMTLENLLMGVGRMHTAKQRTVLERIQQMDDWLSSFMMNQATPHLGALLSSINNENSNYCGQPRRSTALTTEWETNMQLSRQIRRTKKALECKQIHPMMMEHRIGGTYVSNQVRMHACHLTLKHCTYIFDLLQENPQWNPTRLWTKKESLSWW